MREPVRVELQRPRDELADAFFQLRKPEEVADILEIPYSLLIHILYRAPRKYPYREFSIPKKGGGSRLISAPSWPMQILQTKLNLILQSVYRPKPSTQGFVLERSILSNARSHRGKRWVLNVDLQDFFPTINFGRVRGMFMGKPYERPASVATVLAQICCHDGRLPQGAPTSPIVSNMICARLDGELQGLAKSVRCTYTRYADDITLSTTRTFFPAELASSVGSHTGVTEGSALEAIIESNGFKINRRKQRLQPRNRRQEVTGLIVNRFPNVKRRYIRRVRAMLHIWEKHGLDAAQESLARVMRREYGLAAAVPSFAHSLRGKIEFVRMIKGSDDPVYRNLIGRLGELMPVDIPSAPEESPVQQLAKIAAYQLLTPFTPSGTVTFLFSDIEGSTKWNAAVGDQKWMQALIEHNQIIRSATKSYGGKVVKEMGDAFLITFTSAISAVQCAAEIQRNMRARNGSAEIPTKIKIGLHTGEAVKHEDDFYGYHVNYAARVQSAADAEEILISEMTRNIIASWGLFDLTARQPVEFKGLQGKQATYVVSWEGAAQEQA